MKSAFRHFAALGFITAGVLGGYHVAQTAVTTVASVGNGPREILASGFGVDRPLAALGGGYDLSALKNLQYANSYVDQRYVDPDRIDHNAMFRAALDAVEREVPGVLLRLDPDGHQLHVAVGNYTTTLKVDELKDSTAMVDQLKRVAAILDEHLQDPQVEPVSIEYAMINGLLSTLDPHTVFLPPESSQKMDEDNEGEFGGLGITIQLDREGRLTVDYPLEGTPAYKAGLQSKDRILKIEGEETLNMDLDEAVKKMRGKPGTPVTIAVMRDSFQVPKDFTIVRDNIKPSQVWGKLLDGGVGYIRIDQFHAHVEEQLDEALGTLSREAGPSGIKGIVLDLRDNPGGYLHQAVAVADKFLKDGVIVSTVGRDGRGREVDEAHDSGTEVPNVPVAVLTNANSASAAEIVAGALKNSERAITIGERSFGKGSVQNLLPFQDGSQLKLTIARYLTPGDRSIQSIGIPPDIALDRAYVKPPKEVPYEEGGKKLTMMTGPRISLFGRDHIQREADLSGHFVNDEEAGPPPTYTMRYLNDVDPDDGGPRTDRKDVAHDFEVLLARDVLLASTGPRRPDVLRDAGTVVAARERTEATRIQTAFAGKGIGIDWSPCQNPDKADVRMELKVGKDGALVAGANDSVRLEVTNLGQKPICQTAAVATSGNDALNGVEFYIGKLAPGETRGYETAVRLQGGYPTEESAVSLDLLDPSHKVLATAVTPVKTQGNDLPRYAWNWTLSDKDGGNGNGIVEVGETISMNVDVTNVGAGTGGVAEVMLKKDAGMGKSIELQNGTMTLPLLQPGAHGTGTLTFKVLKAPDSGPLQFELRVHDAERFDYASIVMAQFYAYFNQSEKISIPVGTAVKPEHLEPPSVTIAAPPPLTAADKQVTLTGTAADDKGIRDVIIYNGSQKIAYAGGGEKGATSVPFSATADLAEGNNLLVVLVRDTDGLTTTRAVDVYRAPLVASKVPNQPKPGEASRMPQ